MMSRDKLLNFLIIDLGIISANKRITSAMIMKIKFSGICLYWRRNIVKNEVVKILAKLFPINIQKVRVSMQSKNPGVQSM